MGVVQDMKSTWIKCMTRASLSDVGAGITLDTEKNKEKLTTTDVT